MARPRTMKSPNHGHQCATGLLPWRMTGQPTLRGPCGVALGRGKVPVRPLSARGHRYHGRMARSDVRPSTVVPPVDPVADPSVETAAHPAAAPAAPATGPAGETTAEPA